MRTVYLHIGVFKTGSSALQVFFAKNQKQLAADGLEYPNLTVLDNAKRGLVSSGNAAYLARSLMAPEAPMALPEQRGQQLAGFENCLEKAKSNNLLFSSEFFTYVPAVSFATLKEITDRNGFRLKLVAFVREQASYLESLYIQRVKRSGVRQLPEQYIEKLVEDEKHLFYAEYFDGLAGVVGRDSLGVEAYQRENLFSTMFKQLKLAPGKKYLMPSKRVNISLPLELIPLFLELNKLSPPQSFADQIVAAYAKFNDKTESDHRTLLSPEFNSRLAKLYRDDNDRLSAEWFSDQPVFKPLHSQHLDLNTAEGMLDLAGIAKLMGGISVQHEIRLIRLEKAIMHLGDLAGLEDGWATRIKVR